MAKDRDALKSILKKNKQHVTIELAEALVEQIARDGAYSADEKDYIHTRRNFADLTFEVGAEKTLARMLSNLPLNFQRQSASEARDAKLNGAIMEIVGLEGEIGTEKTDQIFALIVANGYTDAYKFTVTFLYNGERLTAEAKQSLKSKIAGRRALTAHKAWIGKKADKAIAALFDGSFIGKTVDMALASDIVGALMTDAQYSDQEKTTMANLYRNANVSDEAKNYIQDELASYFVIDGSIVDVFQTAIVLEETDTHYVIVDGIVDAEEAVIIIEAAGIGKGMSYAKEQTVLFCMETFNVTEDAEKLFDAALAGDAVKKAEKVAEAAAKITEAAEKEETVTDEETAVVVSPSKTLMTAYNELKNKKGQITARQVDAFVLAIFKDGKYTKHEQATMRLLRKEGIFTAAANREILLALRRFIAAKNFAK
jgi:hypothetical protein